MLFSDIDKNGKLQWDDFDLAKKVSLSIAWLSLISNKMRESNMQ